MERLPLETFAKQRGLVSQRLRWWRKKLNREKPISLAPMPAVLPVHVPTDGARRGEPVAVLLRTGHMLKVCVKASTVFERSARARCATIPAASRAMAVADRNGARHRSPRMIKPGRWSCRPSTTSAPCTGSRVPSACSSSMDTAATKTSRRSQPLRLPRRRITRSRARPVVHRRSRRWPSQEATPGHCLASAHLSASRRHLRG